MEPWCRKPVIGGGACLFVVVFLASVACRQNPSPPATRQPARSAEERLEQEIWDVVFLSGERVGHVHTSVFREPRATGDVLRIQQEEVLTLRSNNNRIEASTKTTSIETPDGGLIEFTSVQHQGATPMETTGRVVGNQLQLEAGAGGQKTNVLLPWASEYGGPYRVAGSLQDKPLAPGETRTLRYFDVGTNQLATGTLTAVDFEETELMPGARQRLLRVESKTSFGTGTAGGTASQAPAGAGTINSTLWIDEKGEICKEQITTMFNFVVVRSTREEAQQKVDQLTFDLGKLSAVSVERSLPAPHQTKRIVYRVHLESSDPAQVFDTGLTQQIVPEDEHTAQVTVYAVRPVDSTGNPQVSSEGATDGDLKPNSLIQSDDKTVAALAQQVAGQIANPWQAAVALEKWVSTKMTSLGVSSAFATAAEVARTFKGDCTEHAILLAALIRARGIPARVAIGLVYVRQEFLYHMWTEVYIDGKWIPLDATLGQGGIGAGHLKITDSNLQGASPNAAFLPVTEVIGQLKIEILEVE